MLKCLVFVFLSVPLLAQTGYVNENVTLQSAILGMERSYAVYLPPGYDHDERSYPVLYLLHGAGDDQTGWVQFGEIGHIADRAFREGTATPMIVIMPDADTGQRGYYNSIDGDFRYEDFFFDELMPEVEKKYRIKGEKRYRAVAGLSMGGGGTFVYALHRPDLFSSACPLSAYVGELSQEGLKDRLSRRSEKTYTPDRIAAYYTKYSVLDLVNTGDPERIASVRWFIDCGDDDFLYEGNSLVHIAMTKRKIPHEYRVRDGAHNWTYWREALPTVLSFVSDAFHQY